MTRSLLSAAAQDRAHTWMQTHARSLDQARLGFLRGEIGPEVVLEALAAFQNGDGGFGRALEPDLRTPASSPLATSVAFQVLRRVGVASDHPLVREGIGYLLETYDREAHSWPQTSRDTEEHPHAFWWKGSSGPETGRLNPGLELLGFLLEHRSLVPRELLAEVSGAVVGALLALDEDQPLEMHTLLSLDRLLATPELPGELVESLAPRLARGAELGIATSAESWEGYGLPPTTLIRSPDHPLYPAFEGATEAHLDHLVAQGEEGCWPVPWSWAELDPVAWAEAEKEWTGVLVVDRFELFVAFDRLA